MRTVLFPIKWHLFVIIFLSAGARVSQSDPRQWRCWHLCSTAGVWALYRCWCQYWSLQSIMWYIPINKSLTTYNIPSTFHPPPSAPAAGHCQAALTIFIKCNAQHIPICIRRIYRQHWWIRRLPRRIIPFHKLFYILLCVAGEGGGCLPRQSS